MYMCLGSDGSGIEYKGHKYFWLAQGKCLVTTQMWEAWHLGQLAPKAQFCIVPPAGVLGSRGLVGVRRHRDEYDENALIPRSLWFAVSHRLHLQSVNPGGVQGPQGVDDTVSPFITDGKGAARVLLQSGEAGLVLEDAPLGEGAEADDVVVGEDSKGQGEELVL
ncbi:hypothetical protein FKM82_022289 [Ascaphus truei]